VHASRPANSGEIVIAVIPEEKLPLLFQPAPYQRRVGYALILAREIAAAHGGRMEVESSTDPLAHGTTIRMVLPAD
jgi:signal transduction histidine kinase